MRTFAACVLLLLLMATPAAAQESYVLVVTGLEGDAEHGAQFFQWASKLVDTLGTTFQIPADHVVYLAEKADRDPKKITGPATRDSIEKTIANFANRARPTDLVFIVLFGHGRGVPTGTGSIGPSKYQSGCPSFTIAQTAFNSRYRPPPIPADAPARIVLAYGTASSKSCVTSTVIGSRCS